MGLFEFGIYVLIHLQADYSTGVWVGSAHRVMANAPRGAALREIQRAIEHLKRLGYLRDLRKHGQRGNRPVLINKFTVRSGALKGQRLNADKSVSLDQFVYEPCAESGGEGAPLQEVRRNRKKGRENPAAKPTRPADSRHRLVFDSCFELYCEKFRKPPTWGGREGKTLRRFLREHSNISAEEIVQRYRHLLASTACYHAEKHGALLHLLSNFDAFADGPLLGPSREGASNEKSVKPGFDPVATATALGFGRQILPD